MKETVSDYAAVVSGRFYNEIQLRRLAELISEANCLSPEIGFAMAETLSSPVLHRCENDEESRNLLLLFNMQSGKETEILFLKKKIEFLKTTSTPASRREWLRLVHTDSLKELPDKALFCYLDGDENAFLHHITPLAERYDPFALKLLAAFYRKKADFASETYYLALYEKVISERYYEEPSSAIETRLGELSDNGYVSIALNARQAVLSDFDFNYSRIGF